LVGLDYEGLVTINRKLLLQIQLNIKPSCAYDQINRYFRSRM